MKEKPNCLAICKAACCQDIEIMMTELQYEKFLEAGGKLYPQYEKNVYRMDGKCPFLLEKLCLLKDDPVLRPWVCEWYKFLGDRCMARRRWYPNLVEEYLHREDF